MLGVGFHTGSFNSAYISFFAAVCWARDHGFHGIECGFLDGVAWNHGLGYFPHIASWEDPLRVRDSLEAHGVRLSQIDAAFPLSESNAAEIGIPYVTNCIRWAALAGCSAIDTTDGLHKPPDQSEHAVLSAMKERYLRILEVADRYGMSVNIETHGYFTTRMEYLSELLSLAPSPLLGLTFDTGNVFISGAEPPLFLQHFLNRVLHVHIKDVHPDLAARARGRDSGIGMSHCAIGEGVNADNIRACLSQLRDAGYSGPVSLECEAAGGPIMERSAVWISALLRSLSYTHDLGKETSNE